MASASASGRFEAVADVGDELGVPRHEMGPVEDDGDERASGVTRRGSPPDAELLDLLGGVESVSLEQHGVGHEPQEMLEVLGSAVDQIGEGLGHRGAGHRRECRHLGVGDRLAAEGQQRDPQPETRGAQVVESLLPGLAAPEQADQHAAGVAEVQGAVQRPRLRTTDGRKPFGERLDGGAQGQHLGVDVGDVPDHVDVSRVQACSSARVSWLPDRRSLPPSSPKRPWLARVGTMEVHFPVTVAGQPRISTGVPRAAVRPP